MASGNKLRLFFSSFSSFHRIIPLPEGVDTEKVDARFALQNAASVASLMLTTEAMVAEKPKKKTPPVPAMPSDMEDYD